MPTSPARSVSSSACASSSPLLPSTLSLNYSCMSRFFRKSEESGLWSLSITRLFEQHNGLMLFFAQKKVVLYCYLLDSTCSSWLILIESFRIIFADRYRHITANSTLDELYMSKSLWVCKAVFTYSYLQDTRSPIRYGLCMRRWSCASEILFQMPVYCHQYKIQLHVYKLVDWYHNR